MSFVGLIREVDEEGNQVGPYQCWVNAELLVVYFAIVHEVEDDGVTESEVVTEQFKWICSNSA